MNMKDELAHQMSGRPEQASKSDTDASDASLRPLIILAISDELHGDAIARFVLNHDWQGNYRIRLLHVVEPVPATYGLIPLSSGDLQMIFDQQLELGKQLVSRIESRIKSSMDDVAIEKCVKVGSAKDEIIRMATEDHAKFIIMGSHGKTGFTRFMLGSVSLSVVSHSPCSVIIIRVSDSDLKEFEEHDLQINEDDLPQSMCSYAPPQQQQSIPHQ